MSTSVSVITLCLCLCVCVCVCACAHMRAQAGSGSPTMAANNQDFQRSESDRLNEVKGHLEIALLEKHFLRKYAGKIPIFHILFIIVVCYLCHFPGEAF